MDRESVERLRFDRRLARRRDWVEDNDVNQYVESLPDLSDKMTTAAELEAEAEAQADVVPETPPAAAPSPPAETFGGSTTFGGGSGGFGSDSGGSGSSF